MVSFPFRPDTGLRDAADLTLGVVPGSAHDGLGIVMGLLFTAAVLVLPDRLRGTGKVAVSAE